MSPPRPLVVHPHLHPRRTGVTRHVEAVVPALAAQGFEVLTYGDALPERLPKIALFELWRRVRKEPVVWHAHRNNELLLGLSLRPFAHRMKVVFTRHSSTPPGRYTRGLLRRACRVLALNHEAAAHLAPVAAQVVEHGVELGRFFPPADRAAARARLQLPPLLAIGAVGRVRPAKGQGDLALALGPLLPAAVDWQAILVGRVAAAHRGFAQEVEKALGERLTVLDERPEVERVYQALDILVQPSRTEGFSMVLLEAMASGCCVVASSLPYAQVAVEHGRSGFLYPPGDVQALKRLLQELLGDPGRVAAVGREAAARVRAHFGLEQEASRLAEVYRELLER